MLDEYNNLKKIRGMSSEQAYKAIILRMEAALPGEEFSNFIKSRDKGDRTYLVKTTRQLQAMTIKELNKITSYI